MRQYVVRLGSMREDGHYFVSGAQDGDEWVITSNQRKAARFTSLYDADVTADALYDARVVRLRARTHRCVCVCLCRLCNREPYPHGCGGPKCNGVRRSPQATGVDNEAKEKP